MLKLIKLLFTRNYYVDPLCVGDCYYPVVTPEKEGIVSLYLEKEGLGNIFTCQVRVTAEICSLFRKRGKIPVEDLGEIRVSALLGVKTIKGNKKHTFLKGKAKYFSPPYECFDLLYELDKMDISGFNIKSISTEQHPL